MDVVQMLMDSDTPIPEFEMAEILDGKVPLMDEENSRKQFEGFEYVVDETIGGLWNRMEDEAWTSRKRRKWTGGTRGKSSRH